MKLSMNEKRIYKRKINQKGKTKCSYCEPYGLSGEELLSTWEAKVGLLMTSYPSFNRG